MAVGRITGPLLAKNLLRDGVDLSFETDLLYLDVTNGRIGIKTANPQYTLDVNGDTNILALRVVTTSTLGNLSISSSSSGTTLNNSLGNIVLQAPTESKIVLGNDTLVQGNLHATGNITAEGSVQIGNITGSDTLSLYADIVSNITPQTPNQYDIGAPGQEWANGYFETLVASKLVGQPGQDVNITPSVGNITNINSNVRIWGDAPLGTAPVTTNVLYVTMDGSDTNDGRAMDPSRACRTITGAMRSPFYKEGTSIKVAPGRYFEDNPLRMKRLTSVIGSDLRTTFVEPINKTQDLFWVNSGCYLAQMQFSNGQSGLLPGTGYTAGTNRGAYATAFPPNFGGDKIDLFYSPYIQNCTNQSGPWLYDGTMFIPNQTVQIPSGVGTSTWVANTTTMLVHIEEGEVKVGDTINIGPMKQGYVNARTLMLANKPFIQEQVVAYIDQKYEYYGYDEVKCARDTGLVVDSLMVDLVFGGNGYTQSNFSGLQYWNQDGYTGQIAGELTTTTAAINYVKTIAQQIVTNSTGTRYQSTITQTTGVAATSVEVAAIGTDFNIITTILNTGTAGITDIIQPNMIDPVSTGSQRAFNLLQANKAYIQAEALAYINSQNPGFVYDQAKCYRDVGYMLDSVSFDVLYGGNRQAVQSGVYYYGFSETSTAIPNEIPQTTAAYHRIREIVEQLITNQVVTKSPGNISSQVLTLPAATATEATTLRDMVDLITRIIGAGPAASETPIPISLSRSNDANILKAAAILKANRAFIIAEVIGFIESTYNNGFAYNQPKCYRDTGLIIDSIATDLIYNGDTQSAFSGLQYWNQNGYTGLIETEVTATAAAIAYASSIAQKVVTNTTSGVRYQSTVTQTTGTAATAIEAGAIGTEFGIISNILQNGTVGVTDIIVPNGLPSTTASIVNAYTLLQSNKAYIQAETVAFVNSQYKIFDQAKCARDTGLIVDAIAQDLLFTTSSQSTFAGLQYWNQSGYTGLINTEVTTTTAAINYIKGLAQNIVQNIGVTPVSTGTQVFGTPATSNEALIIGDDFDVVTDIINNGTDNVTDIIIPNGISPSPDVDKQNAYLLLQANRLFLQQEAVAWVDQNKGLGYVYDQGLCFRDTGFIIDSISFDLLYGGNRQAVQSGVYYYGFSNTASAIPGETANTIAAYTKLRELLQYVVQGVTYPTPLQTNVVQITTGGLGTSAETSIAQAKVDVITNIISNGPTVVTAKQPISLTASTSTTVVNAASLINTNRAFIVAEVLAYISNPTNFTYDGALCYRDVGYMIDSISFDLLHGGNRQAVQSGVYYYTFDSSSTAIPNEIPQTTAAYNHIRNIVGKIVTNQPVTPSVGNTATQITFTSTATSVEVTALYDKIDVITGIINNAGAAPTKQPISLTITTNPDTLTAYNILLANKAFIQAETVAFVNLFNTGFVYNRAKCYRDVGIVVENLAYDIAFGGNEKSVESGLAYWNGVTSYIPNEITETTDAFLYLADLVQDVIVNTTATNILNTYQKSPQVINTVLGGGGVASSAVTKLVSIINGIIQDGPSTAPAIQIGNGPDWGSVSAEVLLQANRSFIQNEVLSWINNTYPDFSYAEDKCYRDTGLIVDAVSQDIILNANAKTIEAAKTYWTGAVNVLENAAFGTKNQVVETVAAINRAKQISLQVINNSTVTTTSFVFNPTKCSRDTGLIVDGLAQDLLFGGDSQSTFAGIQYWNHGDYVGRIAGEITTTTEAINYISGLAQYIVQNNTSGSRYSTGTQVTNLPAATISEAITVAKNFATVTNILINGVAGVTDAIIPNSLTASANINVVNAYNLLQANVDYLKQEAIAFVEANKNFRYDETKCARDSGLVVDSIIMDLTYPTSNLSQSTFAGLSYWNQNAYTGQIAGELTTTTAAIAYVSDLAQKVIQNITAGSRYQNDVVQFINTQSATVSEAVTIGGEFNIILDILTNGTDGVTDIIVPNGITASTSSNILKAYTLLEANKAYIQAEVIAFITATKTPEFAYNQETCIRDVGYMIDSVAFDLLHGGNRQAVQSGVYYYTFDGADSAIPNETAQTAAAFEFIKTLSANLVRNVEITPLQTTVTQDRSLPAASADVVPLVEEPAYRIINIIENGPTVVTTKQPISLTGTINSNAIAAAKILQANRAFIQAETIAFVNNYSVFQYNQDTCARDVEYIVNSVSFDLLYGGNRQSVQSGVYYWGYSDSSTSLPKERVASTLAYQYMKDLITKVIAATPATTLYQNTVSQVTNLSAATSVEAAKIAANIDKITTIINEGPDAAGAKQPISLTESNNQFVRNAVNLLSANREFIRAEVIAYVEATQVSNDQVFLPFYDMGANATLSVTRNYDIISNVIENGLGVVPERSDGNGIFVRAGLSNNDVKIAPVVTNVTSLGGNVYQVDISESTIGYGDAQSLYFGDTAVFPLLDPAVPDRWQQRRINPIGSMGGALIDGGVISDRSPINSFVFDAYTQLNQGGNGVKITNNGYAQLVSVFTIFCSNAVTVENGGICSITNSNSNFGDICLTAKGYGKREFSGYVKNAPVLPYYPNGVYPQGGQVQIYIADPDLRPHIALVMEVEPPATFVNNQGLPGFLGGNTTKDTLTTGTIEITGIDNTGMVIGQKFYIVDQFGRQYDNNNQPYVKPGTIVADVGYQSVLLNFPLNSGGGEVGNNNYFNLYSSGNAYYTVLSSELGADPITPGTSLLPNNQSVEEALSLDYLFTLTQKIVNNDPVTPLTTATQVFDYSLVGGSGANQFISDHLDIIGSILTNGTGSTPEVTRFGTLPTGAASAASLLNKNRSFLQDEIIAYVDNTFFNFEYDQVKCARDTGLIVDAISQDLLFDGNSQSTFAALTYWNQNSGYTGAIFDELSTTTQAINYVKNLSQEIVQGVVGTRYSTGTQVTNLTVATPAEAGIIGIDFDVITNILTNGTTGTTNIIVPNSLTSSTNINIVRAYNLLQANKAYIQQEAVAYVESTKPGFHYDHVKCERDANLIVGAIALDLAFPTSNSSQATFAGLQYWNHVGYTGAIASELTTTTNAVNYVKDIAKKIIVSDVSGTRYSTGTQVTSGSIGTAKEVAKLDTEFNLITTILTTGTAGVTDLIVSSGITAKTAAGVVNSYALLQANRTYIVEEAIAYINNQNPGFVYDQALCRRDVGYMLDSVSFDLLYGGNRQAIQSAVYYYDFTGTTAIPNEVSTTTNAFSFLSTLAQNVAQGVVVTPRQTRVKQVFSTNVGGATQATTIGNEVALINNIITSGPGVVTTKQPISLSKTTNNQALSAAELLLANDEFIVAETIAYVDQTYSFYYDLHTCYRDTGYIVDSVSIDLLYGGNRQAVQSGVYYYGFNSTSTSIVGEIPQTVDAYNHINALTQKIILGQTVTPQQTLVTQVTTGLTGTASEVSKVESIVANISNIISNGPNATLANIPLPTTPSSDTAALTAAAMVKTNRAFLVAEATAYIDEAFPGLTYDSVKCERDTALIVDAIAQDLMFESTSQSNFSGVQYWNHGSYVGTIAGELTTTTNAVNYVKSLAQKVIQNIQSGTRYQSKVAQNVSLTPATNSEASTLGADFDVITNILTNGVNGVTDDIIPNGIVMSGSVNIQNAYAVLLANRAYIQAEAVAYVESTKTTGFTYNKDKCYRDVGYMIDAVAIDLLYGGNRQAIQSGVYYYGFNADSTALPGEQSQAVATYNYIRSLLPSIITGTVIPAPKQTNVAQSTAGTHSTALQAKYAQKKIDLINNIIINGPKISKTPLDVSRSVDTQVINAAKAIAANRAFIVAETVAYINNKYLNYNRVKCRRDVGFLVDALVYDLEKGGNYNAVIAGRSYYAEAGTHHIVQLEENVTDPSLFPDGAITTFYQRSYMSASGYLFEYVGAGTNYGSLPQRGKRDPNQSKEVVQLNNGKVFFTSTDQNGDFRIGTGLVISQATGVLSGRTFTKSLFANLTPFILAIEG